jgi:hypothetical protein
MKISEAEDLAGGQIQLAKALKVTTRAIQKWNKESEELPAERFYQLAGMYAMKQWKPVAGKKFPKP